MDRLLSLVPEQHHAELEQYFLELVAEIRKRRNQRDMSEVCSKNDAIQQAYKTIARRVAHLPDEQALSSMMASVPRPNEERCVAHLQLARKRLKRELRADRNRQIAALVRAGRSNAEIAEAVHVSISTAAKAAAAALRGGPS